MRTRFSIASLSILICVLACALVACSSSPKSADKKKKRTILLTEADDARVGREASGDVVAQMGVLDDPELNDYIRGIGRKLLRGVPRRSFQYQFWVVDQVEPNAFALPGGYIFISRGLLALTNNEDELACVIGHEITHAAHRHAAAQQGISQRGNPLAMPWNRAARMAAYGRDMERDADQGGQILAAAAGYNPIGMSTFLRSLGQTERLRIGYAHLPTFFDTHPGSQERAAGNAVRASEIRWKRDPTLGDTRASLLAAVDGLPLGERPESGVFHGDRFIHPDLDFQLRFPPGWLKSNSNMAVGAASPQGDAVVFLMAEPPSASPEEAAEAWLAKAQEQQRIQVEEAKPVKVGSLDAWRLRVAESGRGGSVISYVTFIPYGGGMWRITGSARAKSASRVLGRTLSTTRSFRSLTEEERNSVDAVRLRIATAQSGEDLARLGERTNDAWEISDTAIQNGLFVNHRFDGGELVKIARIEPYLPPPLEAKEPAQLQSGSNPEAEGPGQP
jgi:predicted Zn-dependent protease